MKRIKKNTSRICIYCKEIKLFPLDFNREHVISELFGLFGTHTMTLVGLVCKVCNKYFADNLELHLGRDSTFGILYRSIVGIVQPTEFKRVIHRKRQRIEPSIQHSDHGDLLVDIQLNSDKNFDVMIANQIIIMNSTKGNRIHFRSDQLPHRSILEGMGLKPVEGYVNFVSRADDMQVQTEKFNLALKKAEIKIQVHEKQFGKFRLPNKVEPLYFKSVIDENIQRALAKMVFNYLAHRYGSSIVLSDSFNEIRNFIRYGLKASLYLMTMDNNPIVANLRKIQKDRYASHIITIGQDRYSNNIVGQMSLFNHVRFEVVLSRTYPLVSFPMQGSLFDMLGKRVIDITPLISQYIK